MTKKPDYKIKHHLNMPISKVLRAHKMMIQVAVFALVLLIFGLKITGYLHVNIFNPISWAHGIERAYQRTSYDISTLKYFGKCPGSQIKIDIGHEYLCRDKTTSSIYQKLFDTCPRNSDGREVVYPYLNDWSQKNADDLLKNTYNIDRYKAVTLPGIPKWDEDPYSDRYWRFTFYSLRDMRDLLGAAYKTHDPKYSAKLINILDSFLDTGVNQSHAWDDYHGVAWRSMMLTDIWYKLRSLNQLPIETSNKLLASIELHGEFLTSTNHYEPGYNHGTNEAAALYLLGVDFPDLKNADQWRALGEERLADTLDDLINTDGSLDEHSPYYDFYVLSKYWDLYIFSTKYHKPISSNFQTKIAEMINYATYILQPDSRVPLIGSSLDQTIHNNDEYADMAKTNAQFRYVLTQGKKGTKPKTNSIAFNATGQTIMRSGWNAKDYTQQTQLIFNYGAYITAHSHLDSLSIELYGGGEALLPGPGLYTYDPGDMYNYFHGTTSHNTVVVDSKDQRQGTGYGGEFKQTKNYTSQSASSQLYNGVTQERQTMLFGKNTILIIDKEKSTSEHTYEQKFHIFPGAKITEKGLTVSATGNSHREQLKISQIKNNGITKSIVYNKKSNPIGGVCSREYGKLLPCYEIGYSQQAKDATYITLLQIGKDTLDTSYLLKGNTLTLKIDEKKYIIDVSEISGRSAKVTASDIIIPKAETAVVDTMNNPNNWFITNGRLSISSGPGNDPNENSLTLISDDSASAIMTKIVSLDLSSKNIMFDMNIPDSTNLSSLDLILKSGDATAIQHLKNVYDNVRDNDLNSSVELQSDSPTGWSKISLAKGSARAIEGQWIIENGIFDWSRVSSISFQVKSKAETSTLVELKNLETYKGQDQGKILIVFDDGSASIQPAIKAMKKYNMKGNIGVIGKYPDTALSGYLSISALKKIQNNDGWSIINHSYYHQDAVSVYYDENRLDDFESDVLKGAEFLQKNGINSDPNWYIYPHGTTNAAIQQVLSKYYKFARTELTAPEAYPFGNPLAVKDFIVENNTTPVDIAKAVADAGKYKQTLILTFHRIHTDSSDKTGYEMKDFQSVIDNLRNTEANVMSFNELDKSNGVTDNKLTIVTEKPSLLSSSVTEAKSSFWLKIKNIF